MRKTAELAESPGGFFEFNASEGIGVSAVGPDAEAVEESATDQMRRIAPHRADAEIEARFAKKYRPKLRMGFWSGQDARGAEAGELVNRPIFIRGLRAY